VVVIFGGGDGLLPSAIADGAQDGGVVVIANEPERWQGGSSIMLSCHKRSRLRLTRKLDLRPDIVLLTERESLAEHVLTLQVADTAYPQAPIIGLKGDDCVLLEENARMLCRFWGEIGNCWVMGPVRSAVDAD
jgi:hypothetical protein